jgi:hypothetical protein
MCPAFQAVAKLSKFSQFAGKSSGPVLKNSLCVLNARMSIAMSGRMTAKQTTKREPYFTVENRNPLRPGKRRFLPVSIFGRRRDRREAGRSAGVGSSTTNTESEAPSMPLIRSTPLVRQE